MPQQSSSNPFSASLFRFLRDLKANNDRDWFRSHKARYEDCLKEPSFQFISDFGPRLRAISLHFDAIPSAVGGSLFRIYRDTRFARDKTPYKTHAGLHFRHKQARTAHAPGFYLHLDPGGSFIGLGVWRPDSGALKKIRQAILEDPASWEAALSADSFAATFSLAGDSLKRAPKGIPVDHPWIEDLKRKDFLALAKVTQEEVLSPAFLDKFADTCASGAPFVRYLCGALGVPF